MNTKIYEKLNVGDLLYNEFLQYTGKSINKVASEMKITATRLNEIIKGKRKITADTDLRLCKYFGLSEGFFYRIQANYNLLEAKEKAKDVLKEIHKTTLKEIN